jgi:hypothetical protein
MSGSDRLPRHGAVQRRKAQGYPEAYEAFPWG